MKKAILLLSSLFLFVFPLKAQLTTALITAGLDIATNAIGEYAVNASNSAAQLEVLNRQAALLEEMANNEKKKQYKMEKGVLLFINGTNILQDLNAQVSSIRSTYSMCEALYSSITDPDTFSRLTHNGYMFDEITYYTRQLEMATTTLLWCTSTCLYLYQDIAKCVNSSDLMLFQDKSRQARDSTAKAQEQLRKTLLMQSQQLAKEKQKQEFIQEFVNASQKQNESLPSPNINRGLLFVGNLPLIVGNYLQTLINTEDLQELESSVRSQRKEWINSPRTKMRELKEPIFSFVWILTCIILVVCTLVAVIKKMKGEQRNWDVWLKIAGATIFFAIAFSFVYELFSNYV